MDKYDKCDFELLLKKTAFSRDVALLLYEEGTLSHGQLCEKLNKTKQNLSNAINRIEPFDVLNTRKIGKNVYYSLTYKGNKFVVYIKKEIELSIHRPVDNKMNQVAQNRLVLKGAHK